MQTSTLTLSDNDPKVIAARDAEKQLFDFYGLQAKNSYIRLPEANIRVRITEIGTGSPVLVVPGNTGDLFPLASLMAQLQGRRIIGFNRPGGGLSEGMDHTTVDIRKFAVQSIATVLDALGLEKVDIVAHSMGAHWGLWFAMDHLARVNTLTLLGNPGNVMQRKPPLLLRLISKPPLNKILFKLLISADRKKVLNSLKFMGHGSETIASLPSSFGDCYYHFRLLPHYQLSATSLLENVAPKIDAQQLGTVKQRVLFLLGTKDTFASIETGKSIAAALPHCEFNAINGAGHLPWLESPSACGRLINDFLASSPEAI